MLGQQMYESNNYSFIQKWYILKKGLLYQVFIKVYFIVLLYIYFEKRTILSSAF